MIAHSACSSDSQPTEAQPGPTVTVTVTATPPDPVSSPEASPTEEVVTGSGDSFDDPIALGTWGKAGRWRIKVLSTQPDATDAVMAANQFNDPPRRQRQFYMARIAAKNIGAEKNNIFANVTILALGPSSVAYEPFGRATCGVYPHPIDESGDVYPGGTARGNICWSVLKRDAEDLVMIVEAGFFDTRSVFFALSG